MHRRRILRRQLIGAAALIGWASAVLPAHTRPGVNERVAISLTGQPPNSSSAIPLITPDARFVVFQSLAGDIVSDDTNLAVDVFLRDRTAGTSERVSVANDGSQANSPSYHAAISADGRFVAFRSDATNLVPLDTNSIGDIFVRDRQLHQTERVSVSSSGAQTNGTFQLSSEYPAISRDGKIVAFESGATNLVPNDSNGVTDIFVRDRESGATERISVATGGAQANGGSKAAALSADGRLVFFYSAATNLVSDDTNAATDLFVRDRQTGTTERLSVAMDGSGANGDCGIVTGNRPAVTPDGRFVAFISEASNLVPTDTNGCDDIFIRDRVLGTTERVSINASGADPSRCTDGQTLGISDDGRYVAFESFANLAEEDQESMYLVSYVLDRVTGQVDRVAATAQNAPANQQAYYTALDGSGRYPVFATFASNLDNLIPPSPQFYSSVFLRDRGPTAGILQLTPSVSDCDVSVQGTFTNSGRVLVEASDPADDGETGADSLGAELTGGSVIYRPELGDVLVRLRLASIPMITGATPGMLYQLLFKIDNVAYEVRATNGDPAAATAPQFRLFRCEADASCSQSATLNGGIGTAGNEVRISIPLEKINAAEDDTLIDIEAATGLGEIGNGIISPLDHMALPSALIPQHRVFVGYGPIGLPESGVQFLTNAATSNGAFYALLDSLPSGIWNVWARACLGDDCSALSAPVELGSQCPPPPPVPLLGFISRKIHGGTGQFDVDLANHAIECRSGGANGNYQLVFTFANPLTNVASAMVTSGTGSVSNGAIGTDAHKYIVDLTGVTNAQTVMINLINVSDATGNFSAEVAGSISVLVGDTTGDGNVNSADIAQTKSQSGQTVSGPNFREDVTVDGSLNSADIALVKSKSGTALP